MKIVWLVAALATAMAMAPGPARAQDSTAAAPETLARVVTLPEVVVSTARADERMPIAKTVLGREEMKRRNWGQDTPMALAGLPGTYAYSDAGNGIGYSYLSIRGFPQRRISVLIDGVPLNDPESHEVYWIDHPDLLASSQEVQVQRGVGSALYGAASVGGSVNLETAPFGAARSASAVAAYGSYDTGRLMVQLDSGPLSGGWNLYGRYSRIESDGYRDQSWARLWSYNFAARRTFGQQSLTLNLFGGPETTHLAYKGVPQPYLDGQITGDVERDRRANLLSYPGEADHFFEPHYELLNSWTPKDGIAVSQTLFWFDGEGYYDEQRLDSLGGYRLTPWAADTTQYPDLYFQDAYGNRARDAQGRPLLLQTNLVRHRYIRNRHYGWVPRARFWHAHGELIAGGEIRAHDGHHIGTVISGDGLPPGTEPDHRYYDYHPRTLSAGLYLREEYRALTSLTVTADLAWRHQSYRMRGDVYGGVQFDQDYDFLLPRLGLTYVPRPELRWFASWALSHREPAFLNLFNPEAAGSLPNYAVRDPASNTYQDPYSKPEHVNDFEAGVTWSGGRASATANLFRMDFRDELVDYQFNSDLAYYLTTNAARSVHQGVELSARGELSPGAGARLVLDAAATLGDNHFVSFQEQVDPVTVIDHDGKALAAFPAVIASARARLEWRGASLTPEVTYTGRIYLDQNEDVSASAAPRTVLNLSGSYRWPFGQGSAVELGVRVLNLTGLRYESGGYFDYDTSGNYVPHYVVAAERNAIAELRVDW
jgi:iron complex outermembrane receptor protein